MATYGNIPDQLYVVLRKEKEYKLYGDRTFLAREAFPVSADSEKLKKQAKAWGQTVNKWVGPDPTQEFDAVTVDNNEFHKLEVKGIEHRAEGGVAWKVVTTQGWLVDLREPEFLVALWGARIKADVSFIDGPYIEGNFRWVQNGGQMRLTDTGSDLYKEMGQLVEAKKVPKDPPIKAKDLVVGGVYTSPYYLTPNHNAQGQAFLGVVRANGKRYLAWQHVSLKDLPYDEPERAAFLQRSFWGESEWMRLSEKSSHTQLIGHVDISTFHKDKVFGYPNVGQIVKPEDMTWL